ncbi:hypothetical protein AUEXF2481DRAFT_31505 [Aureobasidium subglaciale EXF-2481]|uniref:Uncharacterized protein n=1 Tax=Aureobasidium subglaciale (strain EXF-2481) TaxID=1043005 RepID=A0A074Y5I0_AURSE|nr:uncharacterized protein AUEXF2481DRAFT_31505 [Aureobasidium subglaciale EXF-2481]KEQ93048.1 hypothetical protein AUEXF2481DRAFT_31505 [Aureobasidium subglaciale EXF-2481]
MRTSIIPSQSKLLIITRILNYIEHGSGYQHFLANSDEKEAKAREQLDILMKLADARLDSFEGELIAMFLDNGSAAKRSVPGKRALRFERSVRVDTSSEGSPGVEQAVDAFFGMGDTGAKGALEGFKSVVKTGLKQILGDTSAGESYDKKFFVCIKHNAIIRVDMYTYRYNFSNEGVIASHKNVLAYILCTSVVDHNDLTVDEMVYLASEFAGDARTEYEAYLNGLIEVWRNLRAHEVTVKAALPNIVPLAITA